MENVSKNVLFVLLGQESFFLSKWQKREIGKICSLQKTTRGKKVQKDSVCKQNELFRTRSIQNFKLLKIILYFLNIFIIIKIS